MSPTGKRMAIVVDPSLAIGLIANTVATIAVGLGAVEPAFGNVTLTDAAGRLIKNSADRPVPILQAPAEAIRATLLSMPMRLPHTTMTAGVRHVVRCAKAGGMSMANFFEEWVRVTDISNSWTA